nr:ABC transporter permease [Sinobaca sp. H24]
MIFIAIYWFVFGYGIRGNTGVEGVPFLNWMMAGITIWFFVQPAVTQGSKSIFTKIKMVARMNFPTSAIPTYVIFSKLYPHLALMVIVGIYMQFTGYPVNMYYVQFPYFLFATIALVVSFVLISSTLTVLIRDIHVYPVLYPRHALLDAVFVDDRFPASAIQSAMQLNPLYYLVEGYRAAYFGDGWYFIDQWEYTLYFWGTVAVFFIIGAALHVRFRRHFVDFL